MSRQHPGRSVPFPGTISLLSLRLALLLLLALTLTVFASPTRAAEARIRKVLPSLLDREGRASLHPSLYERDAYQAYLRGNPDLVGGLRFDVHWSAPRTTSTPVELRLQLRGATTGSESAAGASATNGTVQVTRVVEPPRFGSRWTRITLDDAVRRKVGDVSAWRASLWSDGRELTSVQSFLW